MSYKESVKIFLTLVIFSMVNPLTILFTNNTVEYRRSHFVFVEYSSNRVDVTCSCRIHIIIEI